VIAQQAAAVRGAREPLVDGGRRRPAVDDVTQRDDLVVGAESGCRQQVLELVEAAVDVADHQPARHRRLLGPAGHPSLWYGRDCTSFWIGVETDEPSSADTGILAAIDVLARRLSPAGLDALEAAVEHLILTHGLSPVQT
jgi:hypothetical protein